MALLNSLKLASVLRTFPNYRVFHFLGPQPNLNVFKALPDMRILTEPNDYFTRHGDKSSDDFGKPIMDDNPVKCENGVS